MTVAEARRALADAFRNAGIESADIDARLLVGHVLGLSHVDLAIEANSPVSSGAAEGIDMLAARRLAREPIARIVGFKEFWGLSLNLNEGTLVPRPDTETVVETALDMIGPRNGAFRIADLGTGSGAILLALLGELPNATGIGTDISDEALVAARDNTGGLGLTSRAEFILSDFGAALTGRFDLVVSNPPYIPSGDIAALAPEVRRDPRRALDGGLDGLDAYRTIAGQAVGLLKPDGTLVVELGIGQQAAVDTLFRAAGLEPQPARNDLAGIPRALPASLPASLPARVATMTP
jgi:release factor glutamine methyltransferase